MSESARIQLVKARASVGSFLIEGARGPPGPPGPPGPSGGSGSAYSTAFPNIWRGATPTTVQEAIDRLAVLLFTRTNDELSQIDSNFTHLILENSGLYDAFIIKYNTNGIPLWARRIGGLGNEFGLGISSDASGNVYVTGYYNSVTTVFDSNNTTTFATLQNAGSDPNTNDAFIVKYNTNGTPQWARRIGGTSSDRGNSISSDASGNVYVTGSYLGVATIFNTDNTSQFTTLQNTSSNDAFIVKYNTTGTPLWARRIGGGSSETGLGISSDASGNVYVTGTYSGPSTVFNTDNTNSFTSLENANFTDTFIVKYDTDGTPLWVRRIGGSGSDQGNGISSDASGNVYVSGFYTGVVTIFNTNNTSEFTTLQNAGSSDAFIVKYNTTGTPQWARRIGGSGIDQGLAISSDASGNVYVTGTYSGPSTVFNTDNATSFTLLQSSGGSEVFIVKYDTSGTPLWARRIGGLGTDSGRSISSDASGNVYVMGVYVGPFTVFNTDNATPFTLLPDVGVGANDVFIVKYNTNGTPQWANSFGSIFPDDGNGISSDASGNIYVTGVFGGRLLIRSPV
jgi:hypothetical protein